MSVPCRSDYCVLCSLTMLLFLLFLGADFNIGNKCHGSLYSVYRRLAKKAPQFNPQICSDVANITYVSARKGLSFSHKGVTKYLNVATVKIVLITDVAILFCCLYAK